MAQAHINHSRRVNETHNMSIRVAMPAAASGASFAAFCGTPHQRETVGLYGIRRRLGQCGVVLVHNDPGFASRLGNIGHVGSNLPMIPSGCNMYMANPQGNWNSTYDPLYGLPASSVLDAIAPAQANSFMATEINATRSLLADYLEIMQYQFSQGFMQGNRYPFNLDLLYSLTEMPSSRLESDVLAFLPHHMADRLSKRLSAGEAQQKVFNAVRSFAMNMAKSLWTRRINWEDHGKMSIFSAVMDKQFISVYVPNSDSKILDYLAIELKALNVLNVPYLLVASGISINKSADFMELFMGQHRALTIPPGYWRRVRHAYFPEWP